MKLGKVKILAAILLVLPVFAFLIFNSKPVVTTVKANTDAAETYKAKCALCHKATAEKAFDPAKSDSDLVDTILKGKKAEKPPNMPEYESKGITAEKAQELVTYMRELRKAAN